MIDKLEAGKTYRLIDKEGFVNDYYENSQILEDYFINDEVTLDGVIYGCGTRYCHGTVKGEGVIDHNEKQFFELVGDNTAQSYLWDGKSELEVGMLVKEASRSIDSAFLVKVIKGTQVVLEDEHGIYMSYTKNLSTLLPDPKDEFCNLMLEKVRRLSLDTAWHTSFDIKELSGMCWEQLNGK